MQTLNIYTFREKYPPFGQILYWGKLGNLLKTPELCSVQPFKLDDYDSIDGAITRDEKISVMNKSDYIIGLEYASCEFISNDDCWSKNPQ